MLVCGENTIIPVCGIVTAGQKPIYSKVRGDVCHVPPVFGGADESTGVHQLLSIEDAARSDHTVHRLYDLLLVDVVCAA